MMLDFCYNPNVNLLLLSGNSKRGKEWLTYVDVNLASQFDRTHRHDYAHWENDEPEINLNIELQRLAELQDLSPYMIFAKSAGTILTCKATAIGALNPKSCLFVGLPLLMIRDHDLPVNEWLQKTHFPIIILQHTSDPLGPYREVKRYIETIARDNVAIHELPGDTHDYLEFSVFNNYAKKLIQ